MFRRLSFYLGLLIGIAMLALLGLTLLFRSYAKQFDPAAWLSLQIGRPVLVRGGIEYFYFPWLGLALNQIEIGNPPGAEENRPFLTADTVKIRVKLLPLLLRREIALDRVTLYNPSIVLRRYADRRTNWDDLLEHPLFVGSVDSNSSKIGLGLMQTISLRGLDVLNGSLVWDDSANAVQTRFDAIRLNTGEGLNFHFELDFHFTSPSHNLEAQALLAGDCRLDRQPFDLTLSNTSFGLKTTLHHSNADYVATAAGKADFALAAQELTLNAATV